MTTRSYRHGLVATATILLLALVTCLPALAQEAMPSFSELEEGWNTLKPGGETSCAHGDEYQFFVYPGDARKLNIYFNGGGGCWNAQMCSPDHEPTPYLQSVGQSQNPAWMKQEWGAAPGILDHTHPGNPFGAYTMIHVPYCTGDVHIGNRDVEYTLHHDDGTEEAFTIRHRGLTNVTAVLEWVHQNLEEPESIFISGGSAGGMAAAYYLSVLANRYPGAQVAALADDIGAYRAEEMKGVDHRRWGVPDVLPDQERWGSLWEEGFDMSDLIIRGGTGLENGRIYMFDHAHDIAQRYWVEIGFGSLADIPELIALNRESIRESLPELRSYIAGGMNHTILSKPNFFKYQTGGVRLRDWVASIAAGEEVNDVHCGNCLRTGYLYDEEDLLLIEHAIDLLSTPETWNPRHEIASCPQDAEEFSLACAVIDGVIKNDIVMIGSSPMIFPAAFWDVIYTSTELLDGDPDILAPITYNNRPDATWEEIVELLEMVRERIHFGLAGEG